MTPQHLTACGLMCESRLIKQYTLLLRLVWNLSWIYISLLWIESDLIVKILIISGYAKDSLVDLGLVYIEVVTRRSLGVGGEIFILDSNNSTYSNNSQLLKVSKGNLEPEQRATIKNKQN